MAWLARSMAWATLVGAGAVFGACGSSGDESAGPPASHGGSGGVDGSAGGGGTGGVTIESGAGGSILGCQPACTAPQFCSAANKCIDQGTCAHNSDCGEGMQCDLPTSKCVPGGGCGAEVLAADPVPPNLLVVLDRSCSMTTAVGGKTKWELAVKALDLVVANTQGKLRFGLILFPDLVTPDCAEKTIPIPVADQGGDAMTALLDKTLVTKKTADWYPGNPCVTPIDTALALAATEPAFTDATRQSYVLLVTDGMQTACGTTKAAREAACVATIDDLNKNKKVSTFVLGFGGEVDPTQLTACAEAGGVPSAGATKYYDAQDAASLDAALKAIADKASLSCTIELKTVPPDPEKLYVFVNKTTEATRDKTHTNGWDYDPATHRIVFFGQACDDLKNGTVTRVDVVFGCEQPPVN